MLSFGTTEKLFQANRARKTTAPGQAPQADPIKAYEEAYRASVAAANSYGSSLRAKPLDKQECDRTPRTMRMLATPSPRPERRSEFGPLPLVAGYLCGTTYLAAFPPRVTMTVV